MTKYKLEIEYIGTKYSGWQIQDDSPSVQGAIQNAIFKFCGENTECYSAGRTDAGVHAIRMPAHIELSKEYDPYKILMATNFHLQQSNEDISILNVEKVHDDFHARFSCKKRYYIYKILNRPTRPIIDNQRVWWVYHPLDTELMDKVAQNLVGKHDFSSFRASECQAKSPIKTLDEISVKRNGDLIEISLNAKSFLHHQVRNIVGTLEMVGRHKLTEQQFIDILEAKDRTKAGPTAPACGLYFEKAEY
ncbi:tRNA pseudouridine(38-40) synthase TruA [bacterium]|nr:tRNA pseudouridine(38-40) synthase TruA [bacterium]